MSTQNDFQPTPIRCRVWDGERMHYPDDPKNYWCVLGGEVWYSEDICADRGPCEGSVAMLSTGLHDADGREVWVGDLADIGQDEPVPVGLRDGIFGYDAGPGYGWTPFNSTFDRVVGNVYEGVAGPA